MNCVTKGRGFRTQPARGNDELSPMDRRIRLSPFRFRHIAALLGGITVLGLTLYSYFEYGLERSLRASSDRIAISEVKHAGFTEYVQVNGIVSPEDTIYLDTMEGGQITQVLVTEGEILTAGQPLVRLKNTNLELNVIGREAQYVDQVNKLARARLAYDQNDLNHQRSLAKVNFQIDTLSSQVARRTQAPARTVPPEELENLEIQLAHQKQLRAILTKARKQDKELATENLSRIEQSVNQMTQSLSLVRELLGGLTISAPIAGQLTLLDAEVGQVVSSGQRLGQVDRMGVYQVVSFVDEFYLGRLMRGQNATIEISGQTHVLAISKIYPNIQQRLFRLDLNFVNEPPAGLRSGQTLRLQIALGVTERTLVVANGPYYDLTGGLWVFVVAPNGAHAVRRSVRLGRRNSEYIEVLSGLKEGDAIITSSYEGYSNFDLIELSGSDSRSRLELISSTPISLITHNNSRRQSDDPIRENF